jgi:DNA-binding response OmpR family regulator
MATSSTQLLLVADDDSDAGWLLDNLVRCGCRISHVVSAAKASIQLLRGPHAAVFISQKHAGGDRLRLQEFLRRKWPRIPVIIVGMLAESQERIAALASGADDCIPLSFGQDEVLARIGAMLRLTRRVGQLANFPMARNVISVGDLQLWPESSVAVLAGRPVKLTATEFKLLHCLALRTPAAVDRVTMLREVFKLESDHETGMVAVHMHRLRRKLVAHDPRVAVRTVRGEGYVLQSHSGANARAM